MTLNELLETIQSYYDNSILLILFIASTSLVQISKIPLNPWSYILNKLKLFAKSIGKIMNEDIYTELDCIKNSQNGLLNKIEAVDNNLSMFEDKTEKDMLKNKRSQILKFYNECYRGIKHSREEFDNIFEVHKDYEDMIEAKNLTNGKIDNAFDYIMNEYHRCESNHDFIQ